MNVKLFSLISTLIILATIAVIIFGIVLQHTILLIAGIAAFIGYSLIYLIVRLVVIIKKAIKIVDEEESDKYNASQYDVSEDELKIKVNTTSGWENSETYAVRLFVNVIK